MAITTVNLSDPVSTWVTKTNTISTDLGDVDSLNTSAIDLVQAVNNLEARIYRFDDSSEIVSLARQATGILSPLSVNDSDALGFTMAYDSASGVISLAGAADSTTVKGYFSGGTGLTYTESTGEFKITNNSITSALFSSVVSLQILDSDGTVLKTLYSPGS